MTIVARVHRWLLWVALLLFVLLAVTGAWLVVGYRPSAAAAWNGMRLLSSEPWPRRVHRLAGVLLTYAGGLLVLLSSCSAWAAGGGAGPLARSG